VSTRQARLVSRSRAPTWLLPSFGGTASPNATFVVTDDGVVVVDAPPATADKLTDAIRSVTDKPVTHLIDTRSHQDHVDGVSRFPNAIRIVHAECARLLANHSDPARPLPRQTFDGHQTSLTVGGESIQLSYPGPNREVGNILVWFPAQRLAVMTDAPGGDDSGNVGRALAASTLRAGHTVTVSAAHPENRPPRSSSR